MFLLNFAYLFNAVVHGIYLRRNIRAINGPQKKICRPRSVELFNELLRQATDKEGNRYGGNEV
jgi:hypothetical protein